MSDILITSTTTNPDVIITTVGDVTVLSVIERGPQGIPGINGVIGIDGLPGVDAVGAIPGDLTGDFLRWNETENAWEVKSEPIQFNQIVLTPAIAAILDIEGGLWYDSVDKSVMVCTGV
jgi:hypothetical protein